MLKKSALFEEIRRDKNHATEVKAVISGVEYLQKDIISVYTSGGMFSDPDIGNCASRQIDIEILPLSDIPRQAKIEVFVRLTVEDKASEWIPQGVFFISTREENKVTGSLKIHGYDAMPKASQIWLTSEYDYSNWPMTQREAAEDIAARMGTTVDERTKLQDNLPVDYPVDEYGDLTMTDVLEGIAISNAGNWIITEDGKLLLLGFGDIPPETHYLISEYGDAITFGGVRILV